MKIFYTSALLLLLTSCSSSEVDLFDLLGKRTESAQTRETEDNGNDSASVTIGIVMEDTDFEEEVVEVHLGE